MTRFCAALLLSSAAACAAVEIRRSLPPAPADRIISYWDRTPIGTTFVDEIVVQRSYVEEFFPSSEGWLILGCAFNYGSQGTYEFEFRDCRQLDSPIASLTDSSSASSQQYVIALHTPNRESKAPGCIALYASSLDGLRLVGAANVDETVLPYHEEAHRLDNRYRGSLFTTPMKGRSALTGEAMELMTWSWNGRDSGALAAIELHDELKVVPTHHLSRFGLGDRTIPRRTMVADWPFPVLSVKVRFAARR